MHACTPPRTCDTHACTPTYACTQTRTHTHVRAQVEEECGHSGWYQEGGFIASCTDAADCAKDNSKSTLNLFVSLDRDGSLSFTYTAHGEEFFDFLLFEVNDERVHSTEMWWSSGMFLRRF